MCQHRIPDPRALSIALFWIVLALALALLAVRPGQARAYDVCSASDRAALAAIAQQVSLDPNPMTFRQGEWATVRGAGFSQLPAGFRARFVSLIPALDPSGCPRPGVFDTRFDDAPAVRVVNDGELRVHVPVGVREGPAVFRLHQADTCTWPSAGRLVTGELSVSFASTKRATHLDATPAQPAAPGAVVYLDFDGHREPAYPVGVDGFLELDIPAFGDPAAIDEIVTRVVEDLEPFDVSVTRTRPAGLEDHPEVGIQVVIGGEVDPTECMDGVDNDGDGRVDEDDSACGDRWWWNDEASATTVRPLRGPTRHGLSTDPSRANRVLVAEHDSTGRRAAQRIAQVVSHELGHAFGMMTGHPLSHYQAHHTTSLKTPILGSVGDRDVWFKHDDVILGQDLCTGAFVTGPQDDFASWLSAVGAADDDHADLPDAGSHLVYERTDGYGYVHLGLEGVVGMNAASWPVCAPDACPPGTAPASGPDDHDFFQLQVDGGFFEVEVETLGATSGYAHAGNLDADLELWIHRNEDVGWEQLLDTGDQDVRDVGAHLRWPVASTDAEPGLYAVAVKSEGGVGDLGRYGVVARGKRIRAVTLGVAGDGDGKDGGDGAGVFELEPVLREPLQPLLEPRLSSSLDSVSLY